MKILFICGSAEPGKDGVGDYIRRLCGELSRRGIYGQILSISDYHVTNFVQENQIIEESRVTVSRIPITASRKNRFRIVQEIINNFNPDRISLQYVAYSFNSKGLPFWLPYFLKGLKGKYKWHIMFHELWLGIDVESSFKHKCIGQIQQIIIKKIVYFTNPFLINTQNKLYQFFLESHNIKAEVLKIFGNIPVTAKKKETAKFTQFVLFGTIHPSAPFLDFIKDLTNISNNILKPIKFVFIGKNGGELLNYTAILDHYFISYDILGVQSEKTISQILVDSDFGISTTPYFQSEKSGVFATYIEHNLTAICISREWTPKKWNYIVPNIIKYEKNNLNLIPPEKIDFDLSSNVSKFINSFSKA